MSPLRRINYPALRALSPKYSILPVRPIVRPVVGCGAVHGLVSASREREGGRFKAKRESKHRFPSNKRWHAFSLDPGPRGRIDCLLRSICWRREGCLLEQAVTTPVSSMPWCLPTEATARQLRGRTTAEITRHAARDALHTAHTQSSLPAPARDTGSHLFWTQGQAAIIWTWFPPLSQHSIPLCSSRS